MSDLAVGVPFSTAISPSIGGLTQSKFILLIFIPNNIAPRGEWTRSDEVVWQTLPMTEHASVNATKENQESTEGYSRWKVDKRYGKFGKTGLNNWSISKSPNEGWNQVSRRVSVPCWLTTPKAYTPWKPLVIRWRSSPVSRSWKWMKTFDNVMVTDRLNTASWSNSSIIMVYHIYPVQYNKCWYKFPPCQLLTCVRLL